MEDELPRKQEMANGFLPSMRQATRHSITKLSPPHLFKATPPAAAATTTTIPVSSSASILLHISNEGKMTFHSFYNTWIEQLRQLLLQFRQSPPTLTAEEHHHHLRHLVHKSMSHYDEYYRVKSSSAVNDVLLLFSAPWASALERSLHWIGGWRPTTAFHLIYSESSILFESHVVDILRGLHTGDLGDLSPGQFRRVSELQCETVQEENDITDELSEWQDGASDLAGMYDDIDRKMERLAGISVRADELRLKTIKNLVELLTPQQAAEFLIAAAELQFGIRGWGLEQDHRSYIRQ